MPSPFAITSRFGRSGRLARTRRPTRLALSAALAALAAACGSSEQPGASAGGAGPDANAGAWVIDPGGDLNGFFDCLDAADLALVSAHRGGPAAGLPENALETLQATLADAPALMEIDVAQSADGVLFLMHDATLERTTTGEGETAAASWREISALRLEDADGRVSNFSPPRFADVLAWAKTRTIVQIDFKRSARYEDVADEIIRQGAEDRVILIAYSMASARKLHRLLPDAMISLSVSAQSDLNRAVAAGVPEDRLLGFTGIEEVNPRLLALLDQRRIEGIFGTLGGRDSIDAQIERAGDAERYGEIAAAGVDIIATDRPRAAYAALFAAGRAPGDGVCGIRRR